MRLTALAGTSVLAAACAPKVVEKIVKETVVTQVEVEKVVKETVIVAGTPKVVEKTVKEVVTATPVAKTEIKGTLEIWAYGWTADDLTSIYEPWNKVLKDLYPELTVNVDVQGWGGRREKLYAAAAAGEPPDIWHSSNDTLPTYVSKGVILELNDIMDPDIVAMFSDVELGTGIFEGKLFLIPNTVSIEGPSYNAEILRNSGIDPEVGWKTWDEMLEVAAKVKTDQDCYIETINTLAWSLWIDTVHEAGGVVYPEENFKTNLLEQPAIDALTRWKTEFDSGFCPKEYALGAPVEGGGAMANYFNEKKQVLARRYADSCNYDEMEDFDWIMGWPFSQKEGIPPVSGPLSTTGWSVTKQSKNIPAAAAWMNFANRPEEIAFWNEVTNQTPCGGDAVGRYWKATPCIKAWVARMLPASFSGKDVYWLWQEGKTICAPHWQAVVLDEETVDQALEAADKELVQLMKEQAGQA